MKNKKKKTTYSTCLAELTFKQHRTNVDRMVSIHSNIKFYCDND